MANLCLIPNEGKDYSIIIPYKNASISELIKTMVEDDSENDDLIEIPLLNVNHEMLILIINFFNYYIDNNFEKIQSPIIHDKFEKNIIFENEENINSKRIWFAEFINLKVDKLIDLTNASNYLDIPPLLNLCCGKIAFLVKDLTPDEIKNLFN